MRVSYKVKCNGRAAGSITISSDPQTDYLKKHTNGVLETTCGSDILMNSGLWQQQKTGPCKAVVCPMTGQQTSDYNRATPTVSSSSATATSVTTSSTQPVIEVEVNETMRLSTSAETNPINSTPDTSYGMIISSYEENANFL